MPASATTSASWSPTPLRRPIAARRFVPRFAGVATEATIAADRLILLKPETYMNESGRSVGDAVRFYKIAPGDVTVFHDELDLAQGKVRVKTGGGNAGHNGLRSISDHIGNDYRRVRLGIGHPGDKALVHNYVPRSIRQAEAGWVEGLVRGGRGQCRRPRAAQRFEFSDARPCGDGAAAWRLTRSRDRG